MINDMFCTCNMYYTCTYVTGVISNCDSLFLRVGPMILIIVINTTAKRYTDLNTDNIPW